MNLPHAFQQTILDLYTEEGRAWLTNLPHLLADCTTRWGLVLDEPWPQLSYNLVILGRMGEQAIMLKLGVPSPALVREQAALVAYNGRASARLLAAEPAWGALLLERLEPGTPLSQLARLSPADDDCATRHAAELMRALWRPLPPTPHPFRPVREWAGGLAKLRPTFGGGTGPFAAVLVDTAERLFAELLAGEGEPVLLHGDLHHDNILQSGAGWQAIDPQGMWGEPAYEVGALLRNPLGVHKWPNLPQRMARRLAILADELAIPRERLWGWGMAQAVLSAWWDYEDFGRVEPAWLVVAEALWEVRNGQ